MPGPASVEEMGAKVDYQVAAPAESRTPNLHRAKIAQPKSADGRMATEAAWLEDKELTGRKKKNRLDTHRPSHGRHVKQVLSSARRWRRKNIPGNRASESDCLEYLERQFLLGGGEVLSKKAECIRQTDIAKICTCNPVARCSWTDYLRAKSTNG